ncbi:MAG: cytochrome c [Pseudomonadota bacterium]
MIKRWLPMAGKVLAGGLLLGALGLIAIYTLSEWALRQSELPQLASLTLSTDPTTIEHGRRIARTRGCFGCHGQSLEGQVFSEWEWVDRAIAPALGPVAREATVEDLDRAIRHGIGRDGRDLWSMPSYNFRRLSDEDTAALLSYLRTVDTPPADLGVARLGLPTRLSLVLGEETTMATWARAVPPLTLDPAAEPQLALGEYLAMTSCNECHGLDLRGQTQYDSTPDLSILVAYDRDEFEGLMRNGVARDGRDDLPLMSMVARDRFGAWTDEEMDALYAFLRTLPEREIPRDVFWRPEGT